MICENVLLVTAIVCVVTHTFTLAGYYSSVKSLVKQIRKLESKLADMTEKLKQVQVKILDLNEASGLNQTTANLQPS
jgi:cell division protein FtsL